MEKQKDTVCNHKEHYQNVCLNNDCMLLLCPNCIKKHKGHDVQGIEYIYKQVILKKEEEYEELQKEGKELSNYWCLLAEKQQEIHKIRNSKLNEQRIIKEKILSVIAKGMESLLERTSKSTKEISIFLNDIECIKLEIEKAQDRVKVFNEKLKEDYIEKKDYEGILGYYIKKDNNMQKFYENKKYEELLKEVSKKSEDLETHQFFPFDKQSVQCFLKKLNDLTLNTMQNCFKYAQEFQELIKRMNKLRESVLGNTMKCNQILNLHMKSKSLIKDYNYDYKNYEGVISEINKINEKIKGTLFELSSHRSEIIKKINPDLARDTFLAYFTKDNKELYTLFTESKHKLKFRVEGINVKDYSINTGNLAVYVTGGRKISTDLTFPHMQKFNILLNCKDLQAVAFIPLNNPRDCHCSCNLIRSLDFVVAGGICKTNENETPEIIGCCERYYEASMKWKVLTGKLNTPRYNAGICSFSEDTLYIFCGRTAQGKTPSVEKYTFSEENWEVIVGDTNDGLLREKLACFKMYTNKIMLVGGTGENPTGYGVYNVVSKMLDQRKDEIWNSDDPLLFSRSQAICDNKFYKLIDYDGVLRCYSPTNGTWSQESIEIWAKDIIDHQ